VKKEASQRKSETAWARIDAMRDEDIVIDEDAPEITDDMWARAMPFVPPAPKVHASFRLDRNVLDWYRGHGKGYQALVNHALRVYMDHARAAEQIAKVKGAKAPKPAKKAKPASGVVKRRAYASPKRAGK
jgi:uncharacterized protein (DUF4415 family)